MYIFDIHRILGMKGNTAKTRGNYRNSCAFNIIEIFLYSRILSKNKIDVLLYVIDV